MKDYINPIYVIDEHGNICYYATSVDKNYPIWGISEVCEFLHGIGTFIKCYDKFKNSIAILNEPSFQDIEDYYKVLNRY